MVIHLTRIYNKKMGRAEVFLKVIMIIFSLLGIVAVLLLEFLGSILVRHFTNISTMSNCEAFGDPNDYMNLQSKDSINNSNTRITYHNSIHDTITATYCKSGASCFVPLDNKKLASAQDMGIADPSLISEFNLTSYIALPSVSFNSHADYVSDPDDSEYSRYTVLTNNETLMCIKNTTIQPSSAIPKTASNAPEHYYITRHNINRFAYLQTTQSTNTIVINNYAVIDDLVGLSVYKAFLNLVEDNVDGVKYLQYDNPGLRIICSKNICATLKNYYTGTAKINVDMLTQMKARHFFSTYPDTDDNFTNALNATFVDITTTDQSIPYVLRFIPNTTEFICIEYYSLFGARKSLVYGEIASNSDVMDLESSMKSINIPTKPYNGLNTASVNRYLALKFSQTLLNETYVNVNPCTETTITGYDLFTNVLLTYNIPSDALTNHGSTYNTYSCKVVLSTIFDNFYFFSIDDARFVYYFSNPNAPLIRRYMQCVIGGDKPPLGGTSEVTIYFIALDVNNIATTFASAVSFINSNIVS